MKDHQLRELINDLTAVAQAYGRTQQLREQISHLVVPVFNQAKAQVKNAEKQRIELEKELAITQAAANNSSVENIVLKKRLFQAQCGHQNGPDFADGHDCEGFIGGCKRMGCPGGTECTELPANKSANSGT
jgi:hypothetical protein